MIKLVVLGTSAALPTPTHNCTSFAVKYGGAYLFDACEGVQQQMMRFGVSMMKVNAVFLSHLHADHFLGLLGLLQSLNLQKRTDPLLIVGPTGTKKFLEALFATRILAPQFPVQIKEVARSGKVFENELFTVKAFSVKHAGHALGYSLETPSYRRFDKAKCDAAGVKGHLFTFLQEKGVCEVIDKKSGKRKRVKLADVTYVQQGKKIVYSGDTEPCAAVAKAAKGAELLIHEATFADDAKAIAKEKKHSTAGQAAAIAKKAGAKKLLLIHFSNRYENRGGLLLEAKKTFEQTELAQEGLELSI
jgi:ribonuclease Z